MIFSTLALALMPTVALAAKTAKAHTVVELGKGTWFENIAVRPNGDILANNLNADAGIYIIKKASTSRPQTKLLVDPKDLKNANAVLGIDRVNTGKDAEEVFAFVSGRTNGPGQYVPGSYGIWTATFPTKAGHKGKDCSDDDEDVKLKHISPGKETSGLLNGLTSVPGLPNVVLVADTVGLVARVDLATGEFDDTAFVYPDEMKAAPDAALPFGVNGVKVRDSHLYWSISSTSSIYRIPIGKDAYPVAGAKPELVADLTPLSVGVDDFSFDADGNIYTAHFVGAKVVRVDGKTGKAELVFNGGGVAEGHGLTAVAMGRTKNDKHTLYATSTGPMGDAAGTSAEGAKVIAIDLSKGRREL